MLESKKNNVEENPETQEQLLSRYKSAPELLLHFLLKPLFGPIIAEKVCNFLVYVSFFVLFALAALVSCQRYSVISKESSRLRNLRFLPAVEMTFLD